MANVLWFLLISITDTSGGECWLVLYFCPSCCWIFMITWHFLVWCACAPIYPGSIEWEGMMTKRTEDQRRHKMQSNRYWAKWVLLPPPFIFIVSHQAAWRCLCHGIVLLMFTVNPYSPELVLWSMHPRSPFHCLLVHCVWEHVPAA